MKRITIVDYGMGNLSSVGNALGHLGRTSAISESPEELSTAETILLPGVGAFGEAMNNLRKRGFIEPLTRRVMVDKVPFLGICLGMQLIAETSEELGFHKGLGWIPGAVRRLDGNGNVRLPHIGWNDIEILRESPLFEGLACDRNFYFVHSYHLTCPEKYISAKCNHGMSFVAALQKDNVFATQFHPEKSHENGLRVLKNFLNFIDGVPLC